MRVYYPVCMATNIALDDQLLNEALKIGGKATKKETVTDALREFVSRRKQTGVLELFGSVEYDPKCNYKKQRRQ